MKVCTHCKTKRVRGRADKKFCSLNCKNKHHYKNTNRRKFCQTVYRNINKQYNILLALYQKNTENPDAWLEITLEQASAEGFRYGATSYVFRKGNQTYYILGELLYFRKDTQLCLRKIKVENLFKVSFLETKLVSYKVQGA